MSQQKGSLEGKNPVIGERGSSVLKSSKRGEKINKCEAENLSCFRNALIKLTSCDVKRAGLKDATLTFIINTQHHA